MYAPLWSCNNFASHWYSNGGWSPQDVNPTILMITFHYTELWFYLLVPNIRQARETEPEEEKNYEVNK